ncbi:MAG: hypothetical protein ACK5O9_01980 [Holosporales bacterium]|jgi:hypothetical protein
MTTRPAPPPKPERPHQTADQKKRYIERINACIAELTAFDPTTIQQKYGDPRVTALQVSIKNALAKSFGEGTSEYNRYRQAAVLDPLVLSTRPSWSVARGGYSGDHRNDFREAVYELTKAKETSLVLLRQAVKALEEEIEDMQLVPAMPSNAAETTAHRPSHPYINVISEHSRINFQSHDQSVNTFNIQASDFEPLANELRLLRETLTAQAKNAQDHVTIGVIAKAELAAEEKDASKISQALSSLGTAAGNWVLKFAKELGIAVASKEIAKHLV